MLSHEKLCLRNRPAFSGVPRLGQCGLPIRTPSKWAGRAPHLRLPCPRVALAQPADDSKPQVSQPSGNLLSHVQGLFNVFPDNPALNQKLLSLAVGGMLCSVATLVHDSYLPVYVQDELGLSNTKIGAVQGAAQFLCQLSKGVSGVAGDLLGSQVRVLVFGTFLTLACKPMFALLSNVYSVFGITACLYWFFTAKLFDRLSKGIREAPSKAVMNELAREAGDAPDAAYGLRQSLATAGMLLGSTIASLTFTLTGRNYIATFSVAAIFPAIALAWMWVNFREELFGPTTTTTTKTATTTTATATATTTTAAAAPPKEMPPGIMSLDSPQTISVDNQASALLAASSTDIPPAQATPAAAVPVPAAPAAAAVPTLNAWQKASALMKAFKPVYWQALVVVGILYFARFDASFLTLRAKQVLDKAALPMLTLINTVLQVVLTAPLARYSGTSVAARNRLLLLGFAAMIACDVCFMSPLTANAWGMFLGASLLGIHMALTHSITVSMIASYMPTGELPGLGKISGTAVSFTDLLLGFVLAASNTLAGVLSDATRAAGYGNVGCFAGGATACALASLALIVFSRFGGLGKEELVVRRAKKAKTA